MDPFETWWKNFGNTKKIPTTYEEVAKKAWEAAEIKIATDIASEGKFALGVKNDDTYTLTNIEGVKLLEG